MASKKDRPGFHSLCVQPAQLSKEIRTHSEPIYTTSAYTFPDTESAMALFTDPRKGYIYSRWSNPTVEMAGNKIAALELYGSDQEGFCQMFSSGMAAISAAILSCVKQGESLLTQKQLYGTSDELIQSLLPDFGIGNMRADLHDLAEVERILSAEKNIRCLYLETPSNPMMEVFDIAALSALAKKYGLRTIVDNTFSTPYCQQPLLLGADLTVHSATKYLNGHGTGLGGAVVGTDSALRETVWMKVKLLGGNANPFDAWLILQGLKTLALRMKKHCRNAQKVAAFLQAHPAVARVMYCGAIDHPQKNIIDRQMYHYGGMLSFELKGGMDAGIRLMNAVQLCSLVTTLGTTDTLIQHPASMTHVNVPEERRMAAGITNGLVRMSVGIENASDIIYDLERGL
ncbi:MAG: aminotransferase class I/II-fold pyridoxal phosphate-dependent enzyme [Chitinophagales bacterium]